MSAVESATQGAFALAQPVAKPALAVVPAPVAVEIVPAAPPKDSFGKKLKTRFKNWQESPHGVALGMWTRGIGSVSGYVVPAAVMVPAARILCDMHGGSGDAMLTATIIASVASVGQMLVQGEGGLGNIKLYKNEGYRFPRLASFRDIMCYAVIPGLAGAYVAGEHLGANWGIGVGTGLAALVSSYGFTVMHVRNERLKAK